MAYSHPSAPRRVTPLAIAGLGTVVLAGGVAAGADATAGAAVVFLASIVLAVRATYRPLFTWANAAAALVMLVWLVPIKAYELPVKLPLDFELYRLFIILMLLAWAMAGAVGQARASAGGMGVPLLLMALGGVGVLIWNAQEITGAGLQTDAIKGLSYF